MIYDLLKIEIYNKKILKSTSPITSMLASCLASQDGDITDFIKTYFDMYADIIGTKEAHVNALSSRLIVWTFEYFKVSKVDVWKKLLDNTELIIKEIDDDSSLLYGSMILHESIAHRYVDISDHSRAMFHYDKAHTIARKLDRHKNIYSTLYYQHKSCLIAGQHSQAKDYATRVVTHQGPIRARSWLTKIHECKQYLQDHPNLD